MPIMVNCSCGNVMSVEDQFAGKTVVCNQCRRVTPVPAVGPASQAAPEPGAGTANPYLAQNAGYAAAPAQQGYSQAPQQYYTAQQMGQERPGRGMLITGGVLAILTFVAAILWMMIFGVAVDEGKMSVLPTAVYFGLGLAAIAGIVFASISFASVPWATLTSGILTAVYVVVYAITAPNIPNPDARPVIWGAAGFAALAAVFTFLGVGQAKRNRVWKGR